MNNSNLLNIKKVNPIAFVALAVSLIGVGIGVYLFSNFQRGINKASSLSFVSCTAPSFVSSYSDCSLQNGVIGGTVDEDQQICCTLQVPAEAYPDLQTGSATDVVFGNCCNRDDFGSCVGQSDQDTLSKFQKGYLACQNSQCGACAYNSEETAFVSGLEARYYSDTDQNELFSTEKLQQVNINIDQLSSALPGLGIQKGYSLELNGYISTLTSGSFFIHSRNDGDVRLWVDDRMIIDSETSSSSVIDSVGEAELFGGEKHKFRAVYTHYSGDSVFSLSYSPAYSGATPKLLTVDNLFVKDTPSTLISSIEQGGFLGIQEGESVSGVKTVTFTADPLTTAGVLLQVYDALGNIPYTSFLAESPYTDSISFDSITSGAARLVATANSNILSGAYNKTLNINVSDIIPTPTPTPTSPVNTVAVADTYVSKDNPTTNYGSSSLIVPDGSPVRTGYFMFDLSQYATSNVSSAILNIHVSDKSGANTSSTYGLYRTAPTWSESSITYNTRVPAGELIGQIQGASRNSWIKLDITNSLNSNSGSLYSLLFKSEGGTDGIDLDSRESSNAPYIALSFGARATATPTPVPTPTATPIPTPTVPGSTATPVPTATAAPSATPTPSASDNFTGVNNNDAVWGTIYVGYSPDASRTQSVIFYLDGSQINEDRKHPYELSDGKGYDVTKLSQGQHTLTAEVKRRGAPNYSESITINVVEPTEENLSLWESFVGLFDFSN